MDQFHASLQNLTRNVNSQHRRNADFNFYRGNRRELMAKIENITMQILECLSRDSVPQYNVRYENGKESTIAYNREASRRKFSIVTLLLAKIYRLLGANKRMNKRELYYENVLTFRNQQEIDRALHDVCHILHAPIWQMGLSSTAKGLIAGPVTFELDDQLITVDSSSGTVIPQNVMDIVRISSDAKFVLLIEKDAAFQKLIEDGGLNRLGPVIFVTGKGYPDVNTRMLVRRLWEELGIPILALVDADPFGIDIMLVYRFGSMSMSYHSAELACPAVRWLGVHPTDIRRFNIERNRLCADDVVRLKNILTRQYITGNDRLREEVQCLLRSRMKAEMEGVSKFSACYLTDTYIPSKIINREYF